MVNDEHPPSEPGTTHQWTGQSLSTLYHSCSSWDEMAKRLNALFSPSAPAPTELEPTCMDCGKHYSLSLTLSREQWLQINPQDWGMLCAKCIGERASKLPHVLWINGRIIFADDLPDAPPASPALEERDQT